MVDKPSMILRQVGRLRFALLLACSFAASPSEGGRYSPPLTIAIVNASTVVSNEEAVSWMQAIQRQIHEHFAPIWKIDAELRLRDKEEPGDWVCRIEDEPAVASRVLGAHFVAGGAIPNCVVYARSILSTSQSISQNLSHEILEMLADPWLSSVTFAPSAIPDRINVYLREICDPVSAYSYALDGVTVADFTYPEFWLISKGRSRLDFLGVATTPLEPTAHSYMLVRYITPFGGIDSLENWSYIWGSYCMFGPC